MLEIRQTVRFSTWLNRLRDDVAQAQIALRLRRLAAGNPGDVSPVGGGVRELRIHVGPGYRIYFTQVGSEVVLLLCGGAKRTQKSDIREAKELARIARGFNS